MISKTTFYAIGTLFTSTAFAQDINTNLFAKVCDSSSPRFTNCTFKQTSLLPYSNMQDNELKFKVNYEFKNCNFKQLNIQLNTNKNRFMISSGKKTIELIGYILRLQDTYLWDTKTNEYEKSCSFIIDSINTSFSDYTKDKINDYLAILQEHQSFIESVKGIAYSFQQMLSLVAELNQENAINTLNQVIQNIAFAKVEHKNDEIMQFALEGLELEINIFRNSNSSVVNEDKINEFKNKLNALVTEAIEFLNTTEAEKNMEKMKADANAILKSGERIPNFNQAELQQFKNELSKY